MIYLLKNSQSRIYNIVIKQNKEIKDLNETINDLKKDIKDLKNTNNDLKNLNKNIENIRNKIENLENENKKILEKKIFEENVIMNNKSQIFESINEIDFIITQILKQEKFKNRKIIMNLLY